jgi:hypothetical protein
MSQAERIGFQAFLEIAGFFNELTGFLCFFRLIREGLGNIKQGGFFEISFNNGFSYQMRNRTYRAEALDPEKIRHAVLSQDLVCSLFEQFVCLLRRMGYIPDGNYEIVSPQVSEFYGFTGASQDF